MKIKGSTGGISRTMLLHMVALAVQSLLGSLELWKDIMPPVAYVGVATVLGMAHAILGMYYRTQTDSPLQ